MFGLEIELLILLFFCLAAACAFEFVNGFHDTANAVATVIYTNSLKPWTAVIWSGICNFVGVFAGGIAVAMGIVNLLPVELLIDQNVYHSIAMVLALLFSAIAWNFGTWYYGLPSSSSHTLIGSILGVGLAFSFMPENTSGAAVNWSKASEIGLSLLISPLFGFSLAVFLMFALRRLVKGKQRDQIFKEPHKQQPPPIWIRSILIITCTLVSFFHGSNDGQKGVGLVMLILIGVVPTYFALNTKQNPVNLQANLTNIEQVLNKLNVSPLSTEDKQKLDEIDLRVDSLRSLVTANGNQKVSSDNSLEVRRDILLISKGLTTLMGSSSLAMSQQDINTLKTNIVGIRTYIDYAPTWVILMISLSLGLGTMVGWKRIVKTVGEKIGKQHLTYAQGASAELVAASTIGVSTSLGLPVSTTHVLSSGIAGSMVASKGITNLQPKTIKNILMAWILTLPVTVFLSGILYFFFRWLL